MFGSSRSVSKAMVTGRSGRSDDSGSDHPGRDTACALDARALSLEQDEVRSFGVEHLGALWYPGNSASALC